MTKIYRTPSKKNEARATIGVQLTPEQREWLRSEGERLERPAGWIVRNLVKMAMERDSADERKKS